MAAIILPHRMRQQPQQVPLLDRGNPLLVGLSDLAVASTPNQTLVRGTVFTPGNASIPVLVAASRAGWAWQLSANSSNVGWQIGVADTILQSTSTITIFVHRRSRDTTARGSMLFGYNTSNTDRVLSHAPFSDGNIYWDYGNGNAGSGRVSAAFTKSTDPETLVFIAGPNKGREIWRNGVRLANNTAATATRPASSAAFALGVVGGALTGIDNDDIYMLGAVVREWSDAECREWCGNPWGIFRESARRLWVVPGLNTIASVATSQAQSATASAAVGASVAVATSEAQSASATAGVSIAATGATSQAQGAGASGTVSSSGSATTSEAQSASAQAAVSSGPPAAPGVVIASFAAYAAVSASANINEAVGMKPAAKAAVGGATEARPA